MLEYAQKYFFSSFAIIYQYNNFPKGFDCCKPAN